MLFGMASSSSMPPSSSNPVYGTPPNASEESFAKSLFLGAPAEGLILPFPGLSRTEADTLLPLLDATKRFGQRHVDSARIDAEARIPPEVFTELRALGVFDLIVPKDYGALGLA